MTFPQKNIFQLSKYIAYFSKIERSQIDTFMYNRDRIMCNVNYLNKYRGYTTDYPKLIDNIHHNNIDYVNCHNQTPLLILLNNCKGILNKEITQKLFDNGYDLSKKWTSYHTEYDIMSYRNIPKYISLFEDENLIDTLEIMCQNNLFPILEKQLILRDIYYFTLGFENGVYKYPTHPDVIELYKKYDTKCILHKDLLGESVVGII